MINKRNIMDILYRLDVVDEKGEIDVPRLKDILQTLESIHVLLEDSTTYISTNDISAMAILDNIDKMDNDLEKLKYISSVLSYSLRKANGETIEEEKEMEEPNYGETQDFQGTIQEMLDRIHRNV